MVLRLLGEPAAYVDGRPVDLGPARQRCMLAALAVDAGRVVSVDLLADRVWGEHVPRRARATLHSYISRLRRALAGADGVAIVRRSGGYALIADTAEPVVDLLRFRELCERARADVGDAEAVRLLTEALALWHGEALTGLDGEWATAERDRLGWLRLAAQHDLVDARLRSGHGEELVAELSARAAALPLDERVAGQLMHTLYRAGRAADALEHYRQLRGRLVDEQGTDPGTALQELHRRILAGDPDLTPASTSPVRTGNEPVAVPRQLPAAPTPFVGRHDELDRLDAALPTTPDAAATVVISAIAGAGGIGKTWLALHWAHRHVDRFPDGQLFVDLRGFSPEGEPMDPAVAVRGFLDSLGVEPGRVPVDPHAQAALLRSVVARRRMLLVLDNAADTAQVTPLLPGSETCAVVVTSRTRLAGLTTGYAARHVCLDVLSDDEARALLTDRLGVARVTAEPAAADELVALCGGFPLALGIVAGHAHLHRNFSLAALGAELRDLGLDALDNDDPTASLPTVLSWSHRALTPVQATTFALLGIAPGSDISLPAAASLTGLPLPAARTALRGLEQASLIARNANGRYRMHDLIRAYAATHGDLADDVREAALRRVLDFYTHTAHAADRLLDPHRQSIRPDPPAPGTHLHPLPDGAAALTWFGTEHANLLAAQDTAVKHAWHHTAWLMAWTLTAFHYRQGHLQDRLAVWRSALEAAGHLPDPTDLIRAQRFLGVAHADLGRHEEATRHLDQALTLADDHGDPTQQALTHRMLAQAWGERGDDRRALDHATRSLELLPTVGDPVGQADALNQVGWYLARVGDHDTARAHCQAALTLHQCHHNPAGEAATLDSLGYIDHHTGRHDQAVHHYQRARALYRDLGNTYESANTLDNLGHPHAALGRHDEARTAWREALELYEAQGRLADADRVRHRLETLGHTDGEQSVHDTQHHLDG